MVNWFEAGMLLPFVGKRQIPANRDGSTFDTGQADLFDEKAPCFFEIWAFEWFGYGFPIWPWAKLRDTRAGKPV